MLLTAGITACIAGGGLAIAAPWLSAFFDEPTLTTPLRVLSVGPVAGTGFMLLRAVLQAQEQIRQIVVVDTVRSVAKVALVAVLLFLAARSATAAAWAVAGAFGLAGGIAVFYVSWLEIWPTLRIRRDDLRKIVSYSAPLVAVGFSYFMASQADRLMLGWLSEASSVGVYTVTAKLAIVITTVNGALVAIFKPIASEAYRTGSKDQLCKSYLFIEKWVGAVAGIALLVFAGGGDILLKLFGAEYATGVTHDVLIILSIPYFLEGCAGPTGAMLQMSDGHRIEFVNTFAFVTPNIFLNYVLIQSYGVRGAAATLLSGAFLVVVQLTEISLIYSIMPLARENPSLFGITAAAMFCVWTIPEEKGQVAATILEVIMILIYSIYTANSEEKTHLREYYMRLVPSLSD